MRESLYERFSDALFCFLLFILMIAGAILVYILGLVAYHLTIGR